MTARIQGTCGEMRTRTLGPKMVLEFKSIPPPVTPTWTHVSWKRITDGPPESPWQRDSKMPLVQIWMEERVRRFVRWVVSWPKRSVQKVLYYKELTFSSLSAPPWHSSWATIGTFKLPKCWLRFCIVVVMINCVRMNCMYVGGDRSTCSSRVASKNVPPSPSPC